MNIKDNKSNYFLLEEVLKQKTIVQVSEILSVNKNTIQRWMLLKSVPWQYHVDLKKLLNLEVDYSELTFIEKDQFFTPKEISIYCYEVLKQKLVELSINFEDYIFLEPSAGDGSFYDILPKDRRIGMDIEPKMSGILKKDFLSWETELEKIICLGNPPFGLRGNLALRFLNHASKFCDFVAFILPPLFDSDGKGSCMGRVKNLKMIHSEKIETEFLYPDGQKIRINVVFQIWAKNYGTKYEKKLKCNDFVKIYSLTDGGTPSTTRNKHMLNNCDFYLASSSFEKENMRLYPSFEDLPNRRGYGIKIKKEYDRIYKIIQSIDWSSKSFLATNSSYNLRTSIIENALIDANIEN